MAADLDCNPKVRRAGREGREVFLFVLRRNAMLDAAGSIPDSNVEGWYLADQLLMSEEDAVSGLSRCVRTGLLTVTGGQVSVVGWDDEWSRRPLTEAERKARQRARERNDTTPTPDVTKMSGQDRDSPDSHVGEERRGDKKREESGPPPGASAPGPCDDGKADQTKAETKARRILRIPERAWGAADQLRTLVLEDDPGAAVGRKKWDDAKAGTRLEWADAIRLAVEADGHTYEQIWDVLLWIFKGQLAGPKFIVQSPDALRKKWDAIQANRRNKTAEKQRERFRVIPELA